MEDRGPSAAEERVRAFYAAFASAGDDATARHLHEDYVLRVPAWGIEVSGRDASLAWLRSDATRGGEARLVDVILHGAFAVVLLARDDPDPTESCHVLQLEDDRIRSCCVVG
jgi:plasmid stabilization system protein ParE